MYDYINVKSPGQAKKDDVGIFFNKNRIALSRYMQFVAKAKNNGTQ